MNIQEMKEIFDETICGDFIDLNEYVHYMNQHILRVEVTDDKVLLSRGRYHCHFNKNEKDGGMLVCHM